MINSSLIQNDCKLLPETDIGHLTEFHQSYLKELIEEAKPTLILEFGFNAGHSSILWLNLSSANVISVDPGINKTVCLGSYTVKNLYPHRFTFFPISSQNPWLKEYIINCELEVDITFVDGDHSYDGCLNDLKLANFIKSKYILVDNYEDEGIVNAVKKLIDEDNYILTNHQLIGTTQLITLRRK